jgi:phosphatidylinositol alpha-mannosyltransferase
VRLALTHAYSWPDVRRGAERIIVELSEALAGRGHDVTVLTAGRKAGITHHHGVRTERMRQRSDVGPEHEADFGRRLLPRLVRHRFDAVHSLGPRDAVAAIRTARVRGHRTVYTQLGLPLVAWWVTQPENDAHTRVVRDIDVYGCMSRYALDALATEFGRQGALTPGGVDLERFQPATAREAHPTILFSGALSEPRKGVGTLLEAMALVVKKEPAVRLWLSGPGDPAPLLAAAPAAARACTDALPLGEPGAQAERYGRAWVSVLPSKFDSFGMVLVEALACGTPVVASDHAALPELVTPGRTGYLSPPDDPVALAEALLQGLELSHRPGVADDCRASARPYDWKTGVAPLLEELYTS